MRIFALYKSTEDKKHREWFLINCCMLFGILGIIILLSFQAKGTRLYYKGNNALFLAILTAFILFLGSKEKTKQLFNKVKLLFHGGFQIRLYDIGDLLLLLTYLIAVFSFVFILDFSFLTNYGIRISAVVSVTLMRLLKDLLISRNKK